MYDFESLGFIVFTTIYAQFDETRNQGFGWKPIRIPF